MELDILNEIVSSTVGDLFRYQSKYNILAVPLPKPSPSTNYAVANSGGIKNLVLKQQQLQQSQQNVAQQQQQQHQLSSQELLPVQSSLSAVNALTNRQQQYQQQQPLLSKGNNTNSNVLQILGSSSNNNNILENNTNKRGITSASSSLANAHLLDQSNISQLNISKDTIATRGSTSSLNTSLQNIKSTEGSFIRPDGFLRDSTNVIRTSSSSSFSAAAAPQFEPLSQGQFNQQPQQLQHLRNQIQNNNNLNHQKNQQLHNSNPLQASENDYRGFKQSTSAAGAQAASSFAVQTASNNKAIFNNNFINENKIQNQPIRYSENEWIKIEAPKKLEEAMQRLQLDQNKISMRAIKEMNVKQLQIEKKRVKNELKLFDQAFEDYFHTQPERNQKEPMRPLYVYYKGLKQALSKLPIVNNENDRPANAQKQPVGGVGNNLFPGQQIFQKSYENGNITSTSIAQSAQTSVTTGLSSHQSSYGDNSLEMHAVATGVGVGGKQQYLRQSQPLQQLQQNNQQQQQQHQRGSTLADGMNRNDFQKNSNQNNRFMNNLTNHPSNQHQIIAQQQAAYQLQQQQQSQNQQVLVQAVVMEQKIAAMKKKRGILRDQLQVYQDEFYKTHNRKIKYHKDVLPVEREYKEYKELKKEIIKLEQQQNILVPGNKGTKDLLDNSVNDQNQCGFDF